MGAGSVYSVFVRLGNGDFLNVASGRELEDAVQFVAALNAQLPQGYLVRDSEGNDVDLKAIPISLKTLDPCTVRDTVARLLFGGVSGNPSPFVQSVHNEVCLTPGVRSSLGTKQWTGSGRKSDSTRNLK
jgi:hypothetical protein